MSFLLDPFILAKKMPVLEKQKEDQEWLSARLAKISEIPEKHDLFDYQTYMSFFVKTNLNYLRGTISAFLF
jgi:hypothetical protein